MNPRDVEEFAPVSEQVYLILLTLASGPVHGYGVLVAIEERTKGRVRMGTGTLYSALKRLRSEGLIQGAPPPVDSDDPRRRYYELAPLGREVVSAEARRYAGLADLARAGGVLSS